MFHPDDVDSDSFCHDAVKGEGELLDEDAAVDSITANTSSCNPCQIPSITPTRF